MHHHITKLIFAACTIFVWALSIEVNGQDRPNSPAESKLSDASEASDDFKPLFNGKDLTEFDVEDGTASYRVEDGVIIGRTKLKSPNTFLATKKTYGDFELTFETKISSRLNSGVQIRSFSRGAAKGKHLAGRFHGPQVEIEDSPGEAGNVYGEAMGGGWITEPLNTHSHFKNGQWNSYRVIARGPSITTFVNGVKITETVSADVYASHPAGHIGLQVHSTSKKQLNGAEYFEARWRNLQIKELSSARTDWSNFTPKDFQPQVKSALAEIETGIAAGPYKPDWDSLEGYEIPDWYKDAKLGIFIHWGPYCVAENGWEWYPRAMYIDKKSWRGNPFQHHLKTYGSQKTFGYKDLIPQMTGDKFDANEWVSLFKDAGAKYVVPVAEHHDGFAMYDCSFTQWNAVEMGPKRDIVGQLAEATRANGLKFGVSSHRAFNWLYYVRNENFDNADPKFAGLYGRALPQLFEEDAANYQKNFPPHDQEFKDEWLARTCELTDKYDADLVWFDFAIAHNRKVSAKDNLFAEHLQKFAAYFYNQAAKQERVPILNYKWDAFTERSAVLDLERSKLDNIRDLFWQTDTSVATNTWGYIDNIKYKPTNLIVDDLIDIVSKNGCLLLNVCPRKDGTIPAEQQTILRELGGWMTVNGEAVHGSRPFKIYGEGPTGTVMGHVSESKNKPFVSDDYRFTTHGNIVYIFCLEKTESGDALIRSFKKGNELLDGEIESLELLGSDEAVEWSVNEEGLKVTLPETLPTPFAHVLKLQIVQ